jgi:hypothetical protein
MPPVKTLSLRLPTREQVEIYLIRLADGRLVSRTVEELAHAPDEERIAAGLEPLGESA